MTRLLAALLVLCLLGAIVAATVKISSDAASIFGGEAGFDPLAGPQARRVVIALPSPDREQRSEAARKLAEALRDDAMVARVNAGPEAPPPSTLDFLWQHRFRLAPLDPEALMAEAMAGRLAEARDLLASAAGMPLGDRALRDPTGSFSALLGKFQAAGPRLPQHEGIWQALDGSAALAFVLLTDAPFDAGAVSALVGRIRDISSEYDIQPIVLGPRVIAAEVSAATADASAWVSLAAFGILLLWLLWVLRSARALAEVLVPLALGVASALLVVQIAFGSVHVLALGFGGALVGLALDYALHLLGHRGSMRRHAVRIVVLGVTTTSIAFLAAVGSGLPAFAAVGVFVATGLTVTALAVFWLIGAEGPGSRAVPFEKLAWRLPARPTVEAVLALGGIAIAVLLSGGPPRQMTDMPDHLAADIAALGAMAPLPSGRTVILVEGSTADEVLVREAAIRPMLDAAVASGELARYAMLGRFLPDTAAQMPALPSVELFAGRAREALARAGLAPGFLAALETAYAEGLAAPPIAPADFAALPGLGSLADSFERTETGWREAVALWDVADPARLTPIAMPGVRIVDVAAEIARNLETLRKTVILWLGLGAAAAFLVLLAVSGAGFGVVVVMRSVAAAVGLTAAALTLVFGSLGVFQIMALTLVVGIGIDYGLVIGLARDSSMRRAGMRSVGLCASSTLIAFGIMAAAPIRVLSEIGVTVVIGVAAVLALNLAVAGPGEKDVRT